MISRSINVPKILTETKITTYVYKQKRQLKITELTMELTK